MPTQNTDSSEELVQLDIARQNASKEESIIATSYSWYRWAKITKNLGELALSATPSAAIKFGVQLALQPIADKISEKTGYKSISIVIRVSIACSDPVSSAICYGMQWATDAALQKYEVNNPHLKAAIKIASQETFYKISTAVKSAETYKAASDCITQIFEETSIGVKVKVLQKKLDNQCSVFDQNEKVKIANEKGNAIVTIVSKKVETLPGTKAVVKLKQQAQNVKSIIGKKLENQVSHKIAERAHELDVSSATKIRNSRLKDIEIKHQALIICLEKFQERKQYSENKLKKWQAIKQKAEESADKHALVKAIIKLAKHNFLLKTDTIRESSISTRIEVSELNRKRNDLQLKQFRLEELDNKLKTLGVKKLSLRSALEKANTEENKGYIQQELIKIEDEIEGTILFQKDCIIAASNIDQNVQQKEATEKVSNFSESLKKNRVTVYVWLPVEGDHLTSQINAVQGSFYGKNQDSYNSREYLVGHVSIEIDNNYHSWWPDNARGTIDSASSVVPGQFVTYDDDVRNEMRHPDRAFYFYTLDVASIKKEFEIFKNRADKDNIGWNVFDNRMGRNNTTAPSGELISKAVKKEDHSIYATDNATSCTGFVKKLLVVGGIDKLLPLPNIEGFFSRQVLSSPENITQLLEPAELIESASFIQTRELRRQHSNNLKLSGWFQKPLSTVSSFFKNKTAINSDLDSFIVNVSNSEYVPRFNSY